MSSKTRSSGSTKKSAQAAKPGLKVKPAKDLEPDKAQSEAVRGGVAGPGKLFSDACIKSRIAPVKDALMKLREFQL